MSTFFYLFQKKTIWVIAFTKYLLQNACFCRSPSMSLSHKAPAIEHIQVGFPVFDLGYLPYTREILVAGGGGPSRSGVANGISAFQVTRNGHLQQLHHFSTGAGAVMALRASALAEHDFAAAINNECVLFSRHRERFSKKRSVQLEIAGHDAYIRCLAQADGLLAAGATDGKVHLLKFPSLSRITTIDCADEVRGVAVTASGGVAILARNRLSLHTSDAASQTLCECSPPGATHFRCLVVLADGSFIAAANAQQRNGTPSLLMHYSSELVELRKMKCGPHPITSVAVSVDQQRACFGTSDGSIGVVDVQAWHLCSTFRDLVGFAVTSVAMSHTGSTAFACSANGKLIMVRMQKPGRVAAALRRYGPLLVCSILLACRVRSIWQSKLASIVLFASVSFAIRSVPYMLLSMAINMLALRLTGNISIVDGLFICAFVTALVFAGGVHWRN